MKAVNLLPRELERVRKRPSKAAVLGCAGVVLVTAVLAAGYLQASSALGQRNVQLSEAQARLAAIPAPAPQPATVTGIPQERQARVAALSSALSHRVAWDRVLREVSLVLPDDVWLSQLTGQVTAATPGPTSGSTGQGIRIVGYTYSQAGVARLLSRLALIPELDQVTLNSSTQNPAGGTPASVVQFDVGASLRTSTPTSASTAASTS